MCLVFSGHLHVDETLGMSLHAPLRDDYQCREKPSPSRGRKVGTSRSTEPKDGDETRVLGSVARGTPVSSDRPTPTGLTGSLGDVEVPLAPRVPFPVGLSRVCLARPRRPAGADTGRPASVETGPRPADRQADAPRQTDGPDRPRQPARRQTTRNSTWFVPLTNC